jgi:ATP-dependent Zn protease
MNREKVYKVKLTKFVEFFMSAANFWYQKIELTLENHRFSTRPKLQIQPLKTVTFFSLFPFLLGFCYFIQQKYPADKTNLFFEKNLPGISIPVETLHWDTFQYILKSQLKNGFPSTPSTIYWSDRNLIIQLSNKEPVNHYLVASLKKNSDFKTILGETPDPSILKSRRYIFSLQQEKPNIVNLYQSDLDEIPLKLQSGHQSIGLQWDNTVLDFMRPPQIYNLQPNSLFSKKQPVYQFDLRTEKEKIFDFLVAFKKPTQTNIFLSSEVFSFQGNKIASEQRGKAHAFRDTKSDKNEKKTHSSIFLTRSQSSSIESTYKRQEQIFGNWKLFDEEIRKLFMTTEFIPLFSSLSPQLNTHASTILSASPLNLSEFFQGSWLKSEELKKVKELLLEMDEVCIPTEFTGIRLMSGYQYPDMRWEQVKDLHFHLNFSDAKKIQIPLPASYSLAYPFTVPNFQPPEFLIKSKSLNITNSQDQSIIYQGTGIILDSKTGLDWKIRSNRKINQTFRLWVEDYLRSGNPLTDCLENFFGIFESPEIPMNRLSSLKMERPSLENSTDWIKTLPIFRNGIITNTTSSFFPFERSFQLPLILSTEEGKVPSEKRAKQATSYKTGEALKSIEKSTDTVSFLEKGLPIFEIRIPKSRNPQYFFGLYPSVDYIFSSPINFHGHELQPRQYSSLESGFLPEFSSFLVQETFINQHSSGVYKKLISLFVEKPALLFYDLWEPLTYRSWLVVSQIGFAFLVFRILKALADNYGRELLVYLLDLVALLGFLDEDLKQEIEILMGQREKGFRIILKTTKNFTDIAGIQHLLPEVVELVWFLRNSGREFSRSKTLPRGVLLTGPPGTGKTLLVQALAGEAEVPVLALSGSSLLEPGESGALKLEILFQEARRLAPCIVFIDEMDTLAQTRDQVLQNPMGADEVLESFHENLNSRTSVNLDITQTNTVFENNSNDHTELAQQDMQREKLRILMQFLVELDGIQGRDGVVVIGATNRPEMLDPAIVRPGRFDRVLELGLPGPEKRQDILKLYSQNLGVSNDISWNYLTHRTAGYSAADLASIMNQSTLRAILTQSNHTVETIEHGIDRITTSGIEQPIVDSKQVQQGIYPNEGKKFSILRFAYYQAGKILLSTLLEHHPPILVTYLWPRRTNVRALQIAGNLQKYFFRFARRIELEHRIIGCYAGKAAEILLLQSSTFESNLSDLGTEDIQFAQNLIDCMVQKWYLYSKTTTVRKTSSIVTTKNLNEYRDVHEKIPFFTQFLKNAESSNSQEIYSSSSSHDPQTEIALDQQSQSYFPVAWWQYQVSDEFEVATRHFSDWYRLYLPDPQENERNLEWSPPDEFYHGNNLIEHLTDFSNWNDISGISTEYQIHSLILQSFNKALVLLDQHRELLDKLAYELVKREVLREPEIQEILVQFKVTNSLTRSKIEKRPIMENAKSSFSQSDVDFIETNNESSSSKKTVSSYWGANSRRKFSHWINLNIDG